MNPTMMEQAACQAPQMMGGMIESARQMPQMMGQMFAHPMSAGALMTAGGLAAGKGLLGGLTRNPLVILAAGVAAGYLLCRYQKELIEAAAKITGIGRDFVLHQKENLADLLAETQAEKGAAAAPHDAAATEKTE